MKFFVHRSPLVLKWWLSEYLWKVDTQERVIYLTFDDGPIPVVTEYVLKQLAAFSAKATFFCIGDNVRKHPQVFQELKSQGHSIGNHTFNHLNGWKTETDRYLENIKMCQDILETETRLFRPPYGRMTRAQFRSLPAGSRVVMWDVLTGDFSREIVPEKATATCIRHSGPGTIMLLHDSLKAEMNLRFMLPRVLAHFSEKGYRFEALPMQ
ncbi:polysaccharide deacetylase family protein [Ravibacter arvi]|uniref:Polysaccharide deacetylase family protein n=1 Tax=Ravibacter arvi TaxID=2051041 RepID=A0ABP8LRA2_9BACT